MKQITLGPTLVVLVGPSGGGKSIFAQQFSPAEVVSTDALRVEFAGDIRRQDMNDLVFAEFDRRICTRLEAGLRVVADATHIRDSERRRTARLAARYGARLIYVVIDRPLPAKLKAVTDWRANVRIDGVPLVIDHDITFQANINKIVNGDGLRASVIDTRKEVPEIVMPLLGAAPILDIVSRGYKGILVIGDVHGNLSGLRKMIQLADDQKLFIISLGDIVDYGTDTLKTAGIMADLMFQGKAAAIFANHERKILRWVTKSRREGIFATENGFTGTLSHGNDTTVNQLKAMQPQERLEWETRFIGMCNLMPHAIRLPRYFLTHGAANPEMLDSTEFRYGTKTEESLAVFGETTGREVNGFPERGYSWVQNIPPRQTVVVGHDCRCQTYPFIEAGQAGGRAVFLDTGSSKPDRFPEGRLSAMALDIEHRKKVGYVLDNERFYSDQDLLRCWRSASS